MVKKTGAGGAVVHDGDADRMMAFDNQGEVHQRGSPARALCPVSWRKTFVPPVMLR